MHLFLNVSVKELPNFVRKYLTTGVINVQIPMTKYLGFQYSVKYCSHLSGSDVMLTQSTVSINNKHGIFHRWSCFNRSAEAGEMVWCRESWLVDYQIWGKLQECVYHSWNHNINQLKLPLIEEWEHFHQVFVNEMIRKWRPRLRACIRAHGRHFELRL